MVRVAYNNWITVEGYVLLDEGEETELCAIHDILILAFSGIVSHFKFSTSTSQCLTIIRFFGHDAYADERGTTVPTIPDASHVILLNRHQVTEY